MTMLAHYDRAMAALATALKSTAVDVVLKSRDELDHVKLHAKQVRDRALLADATEFQMRVERWLGVLLQRAKEAGHLREGRPVKVSEGEIPPASLKDIGVDKKLSMQAQSAAKLSEDDFTAAITGMRSRMASGKAIVVDPMGGSSMESGRAIMASRLEPDDSLDYFPTPPWATRALIERVFPQIGRRGDCRRQIAWEPACGEGHIAEVLREYFDDVTASDIHDYGYSDFTVDFLECEQFNRRDQDAAWIITNPPFGDNSEKFVLRALELARSGAAMFVRLQWLETGGRYERVFKDNPPTLIAFFAERVNLCKGRWDPEGSTATAYIWLLWVKGASPRAPFWIPPGCRETLSKPDDAIRFTQHPVARRAGTKGVAT